MEHHTLRDELWRQRTKQAYAKAVEVGHEVMTAAEFAEHENSFLEATRKTLYVENPPSKEFEKWMKNDFKKKSIVKPPI